MSVNAITYQDGWRQCGKCFSLFFPDASDGEGGNSNGDCIVGAEHSPTINKFKIPFAGLSHKGQTNWRWCFKCAALFFNGHQSKGMCPADMGPHSSFGSGNYELKHTSDSSLENSYGWRWCRKCEQLFYCPFQECVTFCPAGGSHDRAGSGFYYVDWIN